MTPKEATQITGGLSAPSKMPSFGYSIPAQRCRVGTKLHAVPGSVCYKCYARKGRYLFGNVKNALERRFQALQHPQWVEAMSLLINAKCADVPYMRWHDSGDLQSVKHLTNICEVCSKTPKVNHWLPTREYKIVDDYVRSGAKIPANLTIRLSALMLDGSAPSLHGLPTSSVSTRSVAVPGVVFSCPAPKQGNQCGTCRACWEKSTPRVDYAYH
jgi:hypothetical protein